LKGSKARVGFFAIFSSFFTKRPNGALSDGVYLSFFYQCIQQEFTYQKGKGDFLLREIVLNRRSTLLFLAIFLSNLSTGGSSLAGIADNHLTRCEQAE
jgi:hypothetical protein